jgi:hypothetical protein
MPKRPVAGTPDALPETDLPIEIRSVLPADTVPARLTLLARQLQQLFDARVEHEASPRGGSGRRKQ